MNPPPSKGDSRTEALSVAERIKHQDDVIAIDKLLPDCRDAVLWRELRRVRAHLLAELSAGHELTQTLDTHPHYDFDIIPRTYALDGGWTLQLMEDGKEVGRREYPLIIHEAAGVVWWAALSDPERTLWLRRAAMPTAAGAYAHYLLDVGWRAASEAAGAWLDSRPHD